MPRNPKGAYKVPRRREAKGTRTYMPTLEFVANPYIVTWDNLPNKPDKFPPTPHPLYGEDHSDVQTPLVTLEEQHVLSWDSGAWSPKYRMNWRNVWSGGTYYTHDTVYDAGWSMVANKTTTDRAAPQPVGDAFWVYDGAAPTAAATAKQIIFGNRFTWGQPSYLGGFRVYTVIGNTYRVYTVEDPLGSKIIQEQAFFVATTTGWTDVAVPVAIVGTGTMVDLVAVVQEPDPTPTTFNGDWDYKTPQNANAPLSGEVVHANSSQGIISVSKTDFNLADRSAELATLTVGDTIEALGIRWAVQSITDLGAYITFGVAPQAQGTPDGVTNFVFETTTATPITRMEDTDYWLSSSFTVQGLYIEDDEYANIVPNNSAYGTDVLVQAVDASEDWDILSTPSSAGGGTNPNVDDRGENWPTGLIDGGELNIVGGTDIEVIAGEGVIVDSYTNPSAAPTKTYVTWNTIQQPIAGPSVAGELRFYSIQEAVTVADDGVVRLVSGNLIERNIRPTPEQVRDEIFLGVAIHNGTDWGEISSPVVVNNAAHTLNEFMNMLGPSYIDSGGKVSEAASFALDRAAGVVWERNRNWHVNKKDPNREAFPQQLAFSWKYVNRDFSVVGALTNAIDPTNYDNAGSVDPVGGSANNTTIQRLYVDPRDNYWILWGQNVYDNFADARASIGHDNANTEIPFILENSIFLGYIISERSQTDWGAEMSEYFVPEGIQGGGGGGTGATTFTQLTDTPADYTGESLKSVRVNAGETGLEFFIPPGGGGSAQFPAVSFPSRIRWSNANATSDYTTFSGANPTASTNLRIGSNQPDVDGNLSSINVLNFLTDIGAGPSVRVASQAEPWRFADVDIWSNNSATGGRRYEIIPGLNSGFDSASVPNDTPVMVHVNASGQYGTFTPEVGRGDTGGSPGTVTYGTRNGAWFRYGTFVNVMADIEWRTASSNASNPVGLVNLPWQPQNARYVGTLSCENIQNFQSGTQLFPYLYARTQATYNMALFYTQENTQSINTPLFANLFNTGGVGFVRCHVNIWYRINF